MNFFFRKKKDVRFMLLDDNTEKVMNLVDMLDDLKRINKVRLAIHILEEHYFLMNMMKTLLSY